MHLRSPPARGWTGAHRRQGALEQAFPARAGMDRAQRTYRPGSISVPRPRGDGPPTGVTWSICVRRSPPARGWTDYDARMGEWAKAFPARAGMDRPRRSATRSRTSVPRPRGDGPDGRILWSRLSYAFPARAGMDRHFPPLAELRAGVPRPRGDGPRDGLCVAGLHERSPPARGWTDPDRIRDGRPLAFPARAGMDRNRTGREGSSDRVPRPRGDGPALYAKSGDGYKRSPPARGWTDDPQGQNPAVEAFPARAGMDRCSPRMAPPSTGVPRPRGDGPEHASAVKLVDERSPPARGWTEGRDGMPLRLQAFPARAGMDRTPLSGLPNPSCVPRPRGDGPSIGRPRGKMAKRSPPARGWTDAPAAEGVAGRAFPARAGMDRARNGRERRCTRVPRPRGDGPYPSSFSRSGCPRSPPARGWTGVGLRPVPHPLAFPARAGMDRLRSP